MDKKQAVIKSLPLVASMLGDRFGVKVHIGNCNKPCTDGKDIFLPSLPTDSTERFVNLIRSYGSHEISHIKYSDFDVVKKIKFPVQRFIHNALEDVRVEKLMGEKYSGCASCFRWLALEMFDKPTSIDISYPENNLLNWILLRLRAFDNPELECRLIPLERVITDELSPTILSRILPILIEFRDNIMALTSEDCYLYSKRIIELLKLPEDKPEEEEQKSNNPSQGEPQKSDVSRSRDGSEGNEGNEALMPESSSNGAETDSSKDSPFANLFGYGENELPEEYSDRVAQAIEVENKVDKSSDRISVAQVATNASADTFTDDQLREIERVTAALRTRLGGLLQAKTLQWDTPAFTGKLNTKSLYRLAVKDDKVFIRKSEKEVLDTAVHILLDRSSSMSETIELACLSCHTLLSALQAFGLNIGFSIYPYFEGKADNAVYTPVKHGELPRKGGYKVNEWGSTPTADALLYVIKIMLPLPEKRKIIFLLSDGYSDFTTTAQYAVKIAHELGIEVYGISLGGDYISTFLEHYAVIYKIDELPTRIFQLLSKILTK